MSDVSYRYKASVLAGRRAIQDDVTGEVTFVGGEPVKVIVKTTVELDDNGELKTTPPVIKHPTPKAKSGKA